jgi:hypothetical protein
MKIATEEDFKPGNTLIDPSGKTYTLLKPSYWTDYDMWKAHDNQDDIDCTLFHS